jgi:beta-1,4-mannosyltransferase
MSGNPYWDILASALIKAGVPFLFDSPDVFTWNWLSKNRNRVDVLHIHFIRQFYGSGKPGKIRVIYVLRFGINLLLARKLGYRIIFTFHDLEPPVQVKPVWADNLAHLMVTKLSHRVIVHCNEASRLFLQRYRRRHNIFIIDHPNYIGWYPNTVTKDAARRKLTLAEDAIVFMFLGGIRPNKGIETLIQAFLKIQECNFRLVIAGNVSRSSDAYSQYLRKLARGDERISLFLHHIPDDEIQVFMNAADIVVLPFSKILTSGSVILAMSFGRPVIIPKMGCLPELIGSDAGWQFEPDSQDSLAETMQSAAISDFHQMGKQAYDKISSYSPEYFAAQTIKAYWD